METGFFFKSDGSLPLGNVLRIVARERLVVENAAVAAAHEAGIVIDASHQVTAITGHCHQLKLIDYLSKCKKFESKSPTYQGNGGTGGTGG